MHRRLPSGVPALTGSRPTPQLRVRSCLQALTLPLPNPFPTTGIRFGLVASRNQLVPPPPLRLARKGACNPLTLRPARKGA